MNSPFTYTPPEIEGDGDIPGWMFFSLCALPYVLIAIDIIGGAL